MTTPVPTGDEALIHVVAMAYRGQFCVNVNAVSVCHLYDGKPTGRPVTFSFRADAERAAFIVTQASRMLVYEFAAAKAREAELTDKWESWRGKAVDARAERLNAEKERDAAQAALKTAVEALKPFSDTAAVIPARVADEADVPNGFFKVCELRRAAAALAAIQSQEAK